MKHVLKLGMALLIAAIVLGICACKFEEDPEEPDIDYTNYIGQDAAIFVRNGTNQSLVAFKGILSEENKLGGIPGGVAGVHGISKAKNTAHFPASTPTEFAMILITEDQYYANKSNLGALQNTPFTRVYVFYNAAGNNEAAYEISSLVGGDKQLRFINNTGYNVEVRERGIAGPTLGYAPANMTETNMSIQTGQYMLYPVFKYYNRARNQIGTIYPRGASGNYYVFTLIANQPGIAQLNLGAALMSHTQERTLGAAWIIIHNLSENALEISRGTSLVTDAMGYSYFNPGQTQTLQINMSNSGGTAYSTSVPAGGLTVGVAGVTTKILEKTSGDEYYDLKSDFQYTAVVKGDVNSASGLTATIDIAGGTQVDFDAFTGDSGYGAAPQ